MTTTPAVRLRWLATARVALPVVALGYALSSVAPLTAAPASITYAAAGPIAATATLLAGIGLVAVGGAAWFLRPAPMAVVAVLAGAVWLAQLWIGWSDGPDLARSLALHVGPFMVALLAHLTLAFPGGQHAPAGVRRLVAAGYGAAAMVGVASAFLYNPFLDPYCWSICSDNALAMASSPESTRVVRRAGLAFAVVAGTLMVAVAVARLTYAGAVGRRALRPVLAPAAAAGAAEAAYAAARLLAPPEGPEHLLFAALFLTRAGALTALAAGLAWALLRDHGRRVAVQRLADPHGEQRSLRDELATSLGDGTLQVAYWLPDFQRYADASGSPVQPQPGRGQAATHIVRSGEPVAVVLHDQALYAQSRLEREIGSAARLALDNERLRVALLARLGELRASRARLVETGDRYRRQLERDLHDGAQQRLLAVSLELRMAHSAAVAAGDAGLVAILAAAVKDAQVAIVELREVAHGIFPAILEQAGLGTALWQLADQARIPVEVTGVPEHRLPADVERAVYLVGRTALDAAADPVERVRLGVVHDDGSVVVDVCGVAAADYGELADRVGALGGRVDFSGQRLRAVIPCG